MPGIERPVYVDSELDGPSRRAGHTAFSNPLAAADAPSRERIESLLFVFFER